MTTDVSMRPLSFRSSRWVMHWLIRSLSHVRDTRAARGTNVGMSIEAGQGVERSFEMEQERRAVTDRQPEPASEFNKRPGPHLRLTPEV
jgi:hypothetical protein